MAACLGNRGAEAHRQRRLWGGGESPGRNASERSCGLETLSPEAEPPGTGRRQQGLSQIDWRDKNLRRGGTDGMVTRMCQATGEALLAPPRNRRKLGRSYNRQHREVGRRREGGGWVCSSDDAGQCPRSEGTLLCI